MQVTIWIEGPVWGSSSSWIGTCALAFQETRIVWIIGVWSWICCCEAQNRDHEGTCCKLGLMGVHIWPILHKGITCLLFIINTRPKSTLKKKPYLICSHAVWESVAMNECLPRHIWPHNNCTDLATKIALGGQKRCYWSSLLELLGESGVPVCDCNRQHIVLQFFNLKSKMIWHPISE